MNDKPDRDSKTEDATEKKLRDELERGNVPVSREASIFAAFSGVLLFATFFLKDGSQSLANALSRLLDNANGLRLQNSADVVLLFSALSDSVGALCIPIFVILIGAGFAASLAQNPPSIVFERIRPDLSKISISEGWHRIFGASGRTEFLKGIFKFLAIGVVIVIVLQAEKTRLINAMFFEPGALPDVISTIAIRLVSGLAIATLVLVMADLLWSRLHWRNELRMTRQELKDEMKQIEGDPLVKSRLRSLALDRRRRSMIAAVSRATLVIANPIHYAIALRYVREEGGAPRVLAKGKDLLALTIRQIAEQHFIPIFEDKALARSMYDAVEVDQMIPPEFYRAVAELIHIIHIHDRRPQRVN
ncbi:MAG: EscU/YscU/HrcU family type III secretion system export apparatus switch protein [Beijerinckiaceae bacterium]